MTEDLSNSSPSQPTQVLASLVSVESRDATRALVRPRKPWSSLVPTLLMAAGLLFISWEIFPLILDLLPLETLSRYLDFYPVRRNGLPAFFLSTLNLLVTLPAIAILAREKGVPFSEYCNLKRLSLKSVAFWLLVLATAHVLLLILFHALGMFSHSRHTYQDECQTFASILFLLMRTVILAPIVEEILWRGFVFRGISESKAGPAGAILITSAVWAILHGQYDFTGQLRVFCDGLIYGLARHVSQSTTVTIVLHGAFNLWVTLQLVMWVEYGWRF
jgi:membrane protease YdiL (CAAX protease family)